MFGFIGNIGPWELILILVVALIVVGPGKLPEVAKSMGKAAREFKHNIKAIINIIADVEVTPYQTLPRSEKKSKRVFDRRNLD